MNGNLPEYEEILVQNTNTGETHITLRRPDGTRFEVPDCDLKRVSVTYMGRNTPELRRQVRLWCGICCKGEELHDAD